MTKQLGFLKTYFRDKFVICMSQGYTIEQIGLIHLSNELAGFYTIQHVGLRKLYLVSCKLDRKIRLV